jgi:hypothetical protein
VKIKTILFSLAFISLFSCKKETIEIPAPTLLYDISGSVSLYDDGVTMVSDSGMLVSIEGSNPLVSATTDANGDFRLEEVEKGTYTLSYSKTGYGTYKIFGVDHTTNDPTIITMTPSLGQKSATQVSMTQANVINDTVVITANTNPAGNIGTSVYTRLLFSKNSNLGAMNFEYFTPVYVSNNNPISIRFSAAELISFGFQKGDKIYVNVSGESFWGNDYFDPNMGHQIFPNLLYSAEIVDFIVP